ncbi:MAG: ABC transporter substrate-binding protein [Bacteroidetes bacterium]|nr:ABC transporter substrate-binding protein [Bacteroidota bacterium]
MMDFFGLCFGCRWSLVCLALLSFSSCRFDAQDDGNAGEGSAACDAFLKTEVPLAMQQATRLQAWQGHGYVRLLILATDSAATEASGFRYLLVDSTANLGADCFPDHVRVSVPLTRAVCVSTTHAAIFARLDRREVLVGMSWLENLYDPELRRSAAAGHLREVSREGDLNLEVILDLEPGLVLTYLTADPEYGDFDKMRKLGVPVLPVAEFMEPHPLGQAEWIRLGGWLLGKQRTADSLFGAVRQDYLQARERAMAVAQKPTVFTGMDYQGSWTVPRGGSFAAVYLKDAGARYVFEDVPGAGNYAVDFEAVLERAGSADFWLHPGAARSRRAMAEFDPRLRHFEAWKQGRVYNNDARLSPGGGNDYWESAILRPDLVLADLIAVFHPELSASHPLVYYRLLPE